MKSDSNKIDIFKVVDNMILHQQIERRDGLTFMRMEKKSSIVLK